MKIDQIQIIPHSSEAFRESQFWYEANLGPWNLLSAESWGRAFWSFCYLYCHFADTIPNSAQVHRYGPRFADSKDSLQSNTSYTSSQGDGSLMISYRKLFQTYFEGTQLNFQFKMINLIYPCNAIFMSGITYTVKHNLIHKHKGLQRITLFQTEHYLNLKE